METLTKILDSLVSSFAEMGMGIIDFLPKLVAAIVVLLIGWLLAKFVRKIILKVLKSIKLDDMMAKLGMEQVLNNIKPGLSFTNILGGVVYWLVMLVFIIASANILEWEMLTKGIQAIFVFLPSLLIAIVIFFIGSYIADLLRNAVYHAANSIGISGSKVISNIVYYLIMIIVGITALNQAGIDTDLVTSNLSIILGMLLLAFAISYGFASRHIVSNMLSAFYGKSKFSVGQHIKMDKVEGIIKKIDSQSVTVESNGRVIVLPSKVLTEEIIEIINPGATPQQ